MWLTTLTLIYLSNIIYHYRKNYKSCKAAWLQYHHPIAYSHTTLNTPDLVRSDLGS